MKKLTAAVLALLLLCACTARFPAPKVPDGWEEYSCGSLHLFYPESEYSVVSSADTLLELTKEEGTATIRAERTKDTAMSDDYPASLAETMAEYHDTLYEETYGLPFDTSAGETESRTKTKGNGKCLCISYDIETTGSLVALKMTASYYHVIYREDKDTCIITFCIVSDGGIRAEEYFGDIISKIYIE